MNFKPNMLFLNRSFDKKRLKALLLWFRLNLSENAALKAVEVLQGLGFRSATQGAISLGLDDLKTPTSKGGRVFQAQVEVALAHHEHHRGNRTPVELFQHLVDTWHRTSQDLTTEVVQLFHSTERVNPVYMMAFSGARGNISQVRQLVGMRGLMADPRGQIVGFPILSNFREGLTITEYFVSCYGARKGVVDTAIRTADAGYLTRRLADVSHHVVVRTTNCGTHGSILLRDIKEGQKTILSLANRLVGRVLAEHIFLPANPSSDSSNSLLLTPKALRTPSTSDSIDFSINASLNQRVCVANKKPIVCKGNKGINRDVEDASLRLKSPQLIPNIPETIDVDEDKRKTLICRNSEITFSLAAKLAAHYSEVPVRSPLSCSLPWGVCQLCYGWGLSEGRRVTLGEAVGIIAAQSIGEPGTQLTLRTFHTGGVFSGELLNEIRAPYSGNIIFPTPLQGLLLRTPHGQIAFLTKVSGKMKIYEHFPIENYNSAIRVKDSKGDEPFRINPYLPSAGTRRVSSKRYGLTKVKELATKLIEKKSQQDSEFLIQPSTVIFVKQKEHVITNQLLAEFSSSTLQSANDQIEITQQVLSETAGQIWFKEIEYGNRKGPGSGSLGTYFSSQKLGGIWVLAGKPIKASLCSLGTYPTKLLQSKVLKGLLTPPSFAYPAILPSDRTQAPSSYSKSSIYVPRKACRIPHFVNNKSLNFGNNKSLKSFIPLVTLIRGKQKLENIPSVNIFTKTTKTHILLDENRMSYSNNNKRCDLVFNNFVLSKFPKINELPLKRKNLFKYHTYGIQNRLKRHISTRYTKISTTSIINLQNNYDVFTYNYVLGYSQAPSSTRHSYASDRFRPSIYFSCQTTFPDSNKSLSIKSRKTNKSINSINFVNNNWVYKKPSAPTLRYSINSVNTFPLEILQTLVQSQDSKIDAKALRNTVNFGTKLKFVSEGKLSNDKVAKRQTLFLTKKRVNITSTTELCQTRQFSLAKRQLAGTPIYTFQSSFSNAFDNFYDLLSTKSIDLLSYLPLYFAPHPVKLRFTPQPAMHSFLRTGRRPHRYQASQPFLLLTPSESIPFDPKALLTPTGYSKEARRGKVVSKRNMQSQTGVLSFGHKSKMWNSGEAKDAVISKVNRFAEQKKKEGFAFLPSDRTQSKETKLINLLLMKLKLKIQSRQKAYRFINSINYVAKPFDKSVTCHTKSSSKRIENKVKRSRFTLVQGFASGPKEGMQRKNLSKTKKLDMLPLLSELDLVTFATNYGHKSNSIQSKLNVVQPLDPVFDSITVVDDSSATDSINSVQKSKNSLDNVISLPPIPVLPPLAPYFNKTSFSFSGSFKTSINSINSINTLPLEILQTLVRSQDLCPKESKTNAKALLCNDKSINFANKRSYLSTVLINSMQCFVSQGNKSSYFGTEKRRLQSAWIQKKRAYLTYLNQVGSVPFTQQFIRSTKEYAAEAFTNFISRTNLQLSMFRIPHDLERAMTPQSATNSVCIPQKGKANQVDKPASNKITRSVKGKPPLRPKDLSLQSGAFTYLASYSSGVSTLPLLASRPKEGIDSEGVRSKKGSGMRRKSIDLLSTKLGDSTRLVSLATKSIESEARTNLATSSLNHIFPGQLVAYGDNIASNIVTTESGQVLYIDSQKTTVRKAQTVLIYSQAIIAVLSGDWIKKGTPLMSLSYQKLVTGDIVQGLPKIEQFFEAPVLRDGTFWSDSLQAKLNQFFQDEREKLPLAEAVRKSFSEIQRVLVEGVLRVYISQGVLIADKHLEVIVRQMTCKGRILYSGDTGFLRNELVSLDKIENVNQVTYGQKALYHPQVRGITDASLESESFLSAASFQETTRVLSRDAIIGKTDLMRGLKERVIVGELIQAGTGLANNSVYNLLAHSFE